MKVGELLPLKMYPAIKMGITVLIFDFIMLAGRSGGAMVLGKLPVPGRPT